MSLNTISFQTQEYKDPRQDSCDCLLYLFKKIGLVDRVKQSFYSHFLYLTHVEDIETAKAYWDMIHDQP